MKCPLCSRNIYRIYGLPDPVVQCENHKCTLRQMASPNLIRAIRRKLKAEYERGRIDGHEAGLREYEDKEEADARL